MGLFDNLGGLLGGIFGHPEKPYDKYSDEYQNWINKSEGLNKPYTDAGTKGLKDYQDWLNKQKDPAGFINGLMGDYNESPYAQHLQQQSLRAGQNAASASGLSGSTPLMQQLQQNAGHIASADQNQWLQNVLGINAQYGQGQNNLVNTGQNSTNTLTGLYNNAGQNLGENAYNRGATQQNNFWNTLGHGLGIFGDIFGL